MAITLDNLVADGLIDVIIRSDSALDVTDEEYGDYVKTLDESKLKYKEGDMPTKWVMKRKLTYRQKQNIENKKVRLEKGEVQIQLGFMMEEVKMSLVDIKNPSNVPPDKCLVLKKTGDGVDEEFLSKLGDIVQELYNVRSAYLEASKGAQADLKKD